MNAHDALTKAAELCGEYDHTSGATAAILALRDKLPKDAPTQPPSTANDERKRTILWDEAAPSEDATSRTRAIVDAYLEKLSRVNPDGSTNEDIECDLLNPIGQLEHELVSMTAERDSLLAFARSVDEALRLEQPIQHAVTWTRR